MYILFIFHRYEYVCMLEFRDKTILVIRKKFFSIQPTFKLIHLKTFLLLTTGKMCALLSYL